MAKISNFIIGLTLFMMVIAILVLAMAKLSEKYPSTTYSPEDVAVYNKLSAMSNLSKEIEDTSNIEQKTGVLDIAGYYVTGAYNTLKVSKQSINTFSTMSDIALDSSELGETKGIFKIVINVVILIVIVIGIIISALVYKEL